MSICLDMTGCCSLLERLVVQYSTICACIASREMRVKSCEVKASTSILTSTCIFNGILGEYDLEANCHAQVLIQCTVCWHESLLRTSTCSTDTGMWR